MRARARAGWAAGVTGEGDTAALEVPGRTPTSSTTRGSVERPRVYGGGCGGEEAAAKRAAKRAVRARR